MQSREDWIKSNGAAARIATMNTGIFPETLLAQAIIESSAMVNGLWYVGQSELARQGNNYFGIKADPSWTGQKITLPTKEYSDGTAHTVYADFRYYNAPGDSFRDYVKFLQVNPRYHNAGVFTANTPEEQADRIAAAGYATDPHYPDILKSVITTVKKYLPPPTIALSLLALLIGVGVFFFLTDNKKSK
jgi:flagellum-specific peptidoglycan hydrolase FlgJ